MPDELGAALFTKLGEGLTGIAAQTGRAIKSSNLLTDQRVTATSSQARRSGMRSELCVPIIAGGVVLGVLAVMSKEHKRFSQEEEALLGTLAGQAGAAIENARIYASEQRRLRMAETMQEVSAKLNESLNEEETLTVVLDQLYRVLRYDSASVLLVEGEDLRPAAGAGFQDAALLGALRFRVKEHRLFQKMQASGEPIVIDDVQEVDGWLAGPVELRSWLGAPLIIANRVIGMLSVDRRTPNSFDAGDADIARRFATQAALAVRNAHMYRALMECESRDF
jgi:GAF domain-containing protein